jgi:fluoroquinolone resistance protein
MNSPYITDSSYKNKVFTTSELQNTEYDTCTFTDCDFTSAFLTSTVFSECEFIDCNFSSAKIKNTAFKSVHFSNCKLLGTPFNASNPFLLEMTFHACNLSLASFYGLNLKNTTFTDCNLEKTDFTNTDLSGATLSHCNLYQTLFSGTNLEKADLTTAENLNISPEYNKVKGAKFSKENALGLLADYKIIIT